MTRLLAAAAIAALALAAVAAAATTGWTPAQMRAEVVSPATKISGAKALATSGTLDGSPIGFASKITAVSCSGLGKASKGTFVVFSCNLTYLAPSSSAKSQMTVWARPWSSSAVCLTAISVGACPPAPPAHPLADDPRACGEYSYVYCIVSAAETAARSKLRTEGLIGVNYGCKATTAFVYKCSGSAANTALTVTFLQGKAAWTTTVL